MKKPIVAATLPLVAALAYAQPLGAWNYAGHMVGAYVAYQRLSPGVKVKVDDTLRRHPDYPRWIAAMPAGGDCGLEAFLQASIWADVIKGDSRFWDPGSTSHGSPTPMLPGYPDMQQHRDWHYINQPLAPTGAPASPPKAPNLLTQMECLSTELDDPYKLAWFIHLFGDAHQPLHAVDHFAGPNSAGDKGGNDVVLEHPARNLHAFWDQILGKNVERGSISKLGAELLARGATASDVAHLDLATVLAESFGIACDFVYTVPAPQVPPEYEKRAVEISRTRISIAGYRLAAILNERLQ